MNEIEFGGSCKQFDSNNYDIVIFLQAMEIERLKGIEISWRTRYEKELSIISSEKSSLELRMKSIQSTNFTEIETRYKSEKTVIEAELRTLREECATYSSRISYLIKENSKLSSIVETYESQSGSMAIFKANIKDLESKILILSQEIERLNRMVSTKEESIQIKELKITKLEVVIAEHEKRIKSFKDEIFRYQEMTSIKNTEIEKLKFEITKHEQRIHEFKSFDQKKKIYEKKISLLLQEIDHLKAISRKKNQEINEWTSKYMSLETSLSESRSSSTQEEVKEEIITKKSKKVAVGGGSCGGGSCFPGINSGSKTVIKIGNYEKKELEFKIEALKKENVHLVSISEMKTQEIESLKKHIEELIKKNEVLQVTIKNYSEGHKTGNEGGGHNRSDSKSQSQTEEITTSVVVNKIKTSSAGESDINANTVHALKIIIKEKEAEIMQWTKNYRVLEIKLKEFIEMQEKQEDVREIITSFEQKVFTLNTEIKHLEEQLVIYRSDSEKYAGLIVEFSKIQIYVSELELKVKILEGDRKKMIELEGKAILNERLCLMIFLLFAEIERLGMVVKKKDFDIEKWTTDYFRLEVAIKENTTIQFLNEEIIRLRKVVEEKEIIITEKTQEITGFSILIKEYKSIETNEKEIKIKLEEQIIIIQGLKEEIRIKEEEISSWKNSYAKLEIIISEYRSWEIRFQHSDLKMIENTKEIERLNILVSEKVFEIDRLKAHIVELEVSISELKISSTKIEEFHSRIISMTSEIEMLNSAIISKDKEIEKWRVEYRNIESTYKRNVSFEMKISEYESRIQMLTLEITRLQSVLKQKDEQISILYTEKSQSMVMVSETRSFKTQITEYSEKVTMMTNEINRLNSYISKKEEEIYFLQSQYKSLQVKIHETSSVTDFDMKIGLLTQEISRLNALIAEKDKMYIELKNSTSIYSSSQSANLMKISQLTQEIEKLNLQLQNRDIELNEVRTTSSSSRIMDERFALLQKTVVELKEQIVDQLGIFVLWRTILDLKDETK